MLLWLADWLSTFESGFGVFRYLTFRGILGVLTALAITLLVGPVMIRLLTRNQYATTDRNRISAKPARRRWVAR